MCAEHASPTAVDARPRFSRRRRLWELSARSHCSLLGMSIRHTDLRRMLDKLYAGQSSADDYELHVATVDRCATRNAVSEMLQRVLDQRFDLAIRLCEKARTEGALAEQWAVAVESGDFAAGYWAALTHPRCSPSFEEFLVREVHMLQHQASFARREDCKALAGVIAENATLTRELGRVQQRTTRWQAERVAEREETEATLVGLRAELLARESEIESLRGRSAPHEIEADREGRETLARLVRTMAARIRVLERDLRDAARVPASAAVAAVETAPTPASPVRLDLRNRNVLCVGGRHRQIPIYRDMVERSGGRFAHHDGGLEDNPHRLDQILAAADLVICQAGCISHNAYWLVKGHCKRTGKQCLYLDKASTESFAKGLARIAEPMLEQ